MQMSLSTKNDSNWAYLPEHLLDVVLDRLVDVSDYIRFSAVSKHWLSTAQFHKERQKSSQKQQQLLPMFLVQNRRSINYRLHNVVGNTKGNKAANLHVPDYYNNENMRCCGFSRGWLIFINDDDKLTLTLFNPFTRATIHLPPFTRMTYVMKAVLSEDPSLCPDTYQVLVAIMYNNFDDFLWLFRSKSDSWVHVERPHFPEFPLLERPGMSDAIYYRGKFYIVTNKRCFIMVEAGDGSSAPRAILRRLVLEQHPDYEWESPKLYLAESCTGCLLYIERGYYESVTHGRTTGFKVYKMNLNHEEDPTMCTVQLNLGGETLFVEFHRSLSVLASEFSGCQPDCIYCLDYNIGDNIVVYDIVRRRVADRVSLGISTLIADPPTHPPIWIGPEVKLNTLPS